VAAAGNPPPPIVKTETARIRAVSRGGRGVVD
jgi:hypothetical protein